MKRFQLLIILFFVLPAQAEIYKWTDEQGNVHYGDRPRQDAAELQVDTEKKGHMESSVSREEKRRRLLDAIQEDKQREQEQKAKEKKQKKQRERQCIVARDRLKNYQRASGIYNLDKDGKRVFLSNEQRNKTVQRLQKNISKFCN